MIPFRLGFFQIFHMAGLFTGMHVAPFQITIDAVFLNPFPNQFRGGIGDIPRGPRCFFAKPVADRRHRFVKSRANLAAIPAGCAKADGFRFYNHNGQARFSQFQCSRQPRIARPQNRDIGLNLPL